MLGIINHFAGNIVLSLTNILFAKIILDKKIKIKWWQFAVLILFMATFHTVAVYKIVGIIKTLLTCLFITIGYRLCFDINWKKSLFLTIMYFIIILIPDLLVLLIAIGLFNVDKVFYYNNLAGGFIITGCVCILLLMLTILLRKLLSKLLNIKLENNTKIVIFSGLTLICVGIIFYQVIDSYEINNSIVVYLIMIAIFVVILFSLVREKVDKDNLIIRYERLLVFMKTFEKEIEEQRILRHENKNNLVAIKSKIIDNDTNDNLINYIDELIDDYRKVDKEEYAKYVYLPSNGIRGLFYYKTDEAEQNGINVKINVSKDMKNTFLSKLNTKQFKALGNILGVYLDNAIEASSLSVDKNMGIEIYTKKNSVEFIISNTFANTINKGKIGLVSYSTKGKNRGHGLLLVNYIIGQNKDIFESYREITDKLYIQKLVVKKSNK